MCLSVPINAALAQENDTDSDLGPKNWSSDAANANWSSDAYSPTSVRPNYGDSFNQDGTPKSEGESDAPYDSYLDPSHPLKNPNKPPRTWIDQVTVDADGDGKPDVDSDGKQITKPAERGAVFPEDGSPPVQQEKGDIDWGEQYYDGKFQQPLQITNLCASPRPVSITVSNLPYLTLPNSLTLQAGETRVIRANVVLPPEPDPPLILGLPGEPGWGWVEFPTPAPAFPPTQLHQPNFAQIKGTVEFWHPWAPAAAGNGGDCLPKLTTYTVVGHIHFRPPVPEDADPGPSQLAKTDVCTLYWNLGVRPEQLGETDCTLKMRKLAQTFVQKILNPYVLNSPDDWLWLPSSEEIESMNVQEMLAMKRRAEQVMGW
jgi:hypothetical protein